MAYATIPAVSPPVVSRAPGEAAGRIPSLDGLRAVSIFLVVLSHAVRKPGQVSGYTHHLGALGVSVFFVISGYLITALLIRERETTGRISLPHFYIRRAFRIWPALYTYVGVVAALAAFGILTVTRGEVLCASLFVWNYSPYLGSWLLGHTWSLSVEEQFYLIWPVLLVVAGKKHGARVAAAIILCSPVIRLFTYAVAPASRGAIDTMLHTRADTLMFGALCALLYSKPEFQAFLRRVYTAGWQFAAIPFLFAIHPLLGQLFRGKYMLTAGWTLEGLSISLLMLWVVQRPHTRIAGFLNARPMVHLGLISYSLYLWQQIFFAPSNTSFLGRFPISLLCALAAAQLSYTLIERPFLRLRKRLAPGA
ncbi:MAG TPA: acyltransferase [Bryobacteraceae bacterium]|nr:acyltransferase [Bryobacteraceae bacterium]